MRLLLFKKLALFEALYLRLGVPEQQQKEMLSVTNSETREEVWPAVAKCVCCQAKFGSPSYTACFQSLPELFLQVEFSVSFPGLKTVYTIMEVRCEVLNPQDQSHLVWNCVPALNRGTLRDAQLQDQRWQYIGLPSAEDFTFCRQDTALNHKESWSPSLISSSSRLQAWRSSSQRGSTIWFLPGAGQFEEHLEDSHVHAQPRTTGIHNRDLKAEEEWYLHIRDNSLPSLSPDVRLWLKLRVAHFAFKDGFRVSPVWRAVLRVLAGFSAAMLDRSSAVSPARGVAGHPCHHLLAAHNVGKQAPRTVPGCG